MINKNIIALGVVSFFTDMASAMINPILPIFVVYTLKEGVDKVGEIVAISTFISYFLRVLSGFVADRFGFIKPLVVGGYALSAFSKPLIGFSESYRDVMFLKSLERVGKALRSAPKDRMISFYSVKKREGRAFGFHKTLDIAGELFGNLILFFSLLILGSGEEIIRDIFYSTLIPGLIALFIVIFFVENIKREKKRVDFKITSKDKKVIGELFFYFLFLFFMFNEAFFAMGAKERGVLIFLIPILFILSALTQTLTSYLFGVFIDKMGYEKIVLFSYLSAIFSLFFLFFNSLFFVGVSFFLFGLFSVSSLNANRALIAKKSDNQATVYGIFYAMIALFASLGAYVCGEVWNIWGIKGALYFSIFGEIFTLLIFIFRFRLWRILK